MDRGRVIKRAAWFAASVTTALAALAWAWRKPLRHKERWLDDPPEPWGWSR